MAGTRSRQEWGLPVGNAGATRMDCPLQGCLLFLQNHLRQLLLDYTAGYSTCRGETPSGVGVGGQVASLHIFCPLPCPHPQYEVSQRLLRQEPSPRLHLRQPPFPPHLHSQAEGDPSRCHSYSSPYVPMDTGLGRPPSLLRLLLSLLRSCRSSCSCCPMGNSGIGVSIESCGQGWPPRKGQGVEH